MNRRFFGGVGFDMLKPGRLRRRGSDECYCGYLAVIR
jgi:hypothetical protein